nr:hypothetical protein CFP56_20480 [Quercus suber]
MVVGEHELHPYHVHRESHAAGSRAAGYLTVAVVYSLIVPVWLTRREGLHPIVLPCWISAPRKFHLRPWTRGYCASIATDCHVSVDGPRRARFHPTMARGNSAHPRRMSVTLT